MPRHTSRPKSRYAQPSSPRFRTGYDTPAVIVAPVRPDRGPCATYGCCGALEQLHLRRDDGRTPCGLCRCPIYKPPAVTR